MKLATQTQIDESSLIEMAKGGDRQAFGQLVSDHRQGVVNVVYRMCGDPHLAEDMAQEAFLRAWQKLPDYQPKAPFRYWVYRIATNAALDVLRRRRETLDVDELQVPADTPDMEDRSTTAARTRQVQQAVMALPAASPQRAGAAGVRRPFVPGDRRDAGYPHRHGHVTFELRPRQAARNAGRTPGGPMSEHVIKLLDAYHDGELNQWQVEQVEAHLTECPDCRHELENLRRLSDLLRSAPDMESAASPEDFVRRVQRRLDNTPRPASWRSGFRLSWQLAPLGMMLVLVFVQTTMQLSNIVSVMGVFGSEQVGGRRGAAATAFGRRAADRAAELRHQRRQRPAVGQPGHRGPVRLRPDLQPDAAGHDQPAGAQLAGRLVGGAAEP